jgi:hypothetical protein
MAGPAAGLVPVENAPQRTFDRATHPIDLVARAGYLGGPSRPRIIVASVTGRDRICPAQTDRAGDGLAFRCTLDVSYKRREHTNGSIL